MIEFWHWLWLAFACAAFVVGCGVGYYTAATDLTAHEEQAFERGFAEGRIQGGDTLTTTPGIRSGTQREAP